ncbi:unnamed protein product, partial [Didymodactylos carnosus]
IALDQTIECTINKFGKGHGGISGRFNPDLIDTWNNSFAFRALLTTATHEICQLETSHNSIDSHAECTPQRQAADDEDLTIIISKLKQEKLFVSDSLNCRKLLSGKIIHNDIINNICSSFEQGVQALTAYIDERLVNQTVAIDKPLKAMFRLKLRDIDTYVPGDLSTVKKRRTTTSNSKDLNKTLKKVDEDIRRMIIIAKDRHLHLPTLFAHEFTAAPLSLCDNQNFELMNQQKKSAAIEYLKEQFPSSFSISCPITTYKCALVIDGGSLLESKPTLRNCTVRDYAVQLLKTIINRYFQHYERIDIVFDSSESKNVKAYIKRHGNDIEANNYDLQIDDRLETSYHHFVHNNRAILADRVRECWCEPALVELLPENKILVAAGPTETAFILKKNSQPVRDYLLESNHIEADTRMLLHAKVLAIDEYKNVVIQASDTDVVLLSIGYGSVTGLESLVVKSFNTTTKTDTYIYSTRIAKELKQKFNINPSVLLSLHALSGCDTTSFVKNITKVKFFRTFFTNHHRYSDINNFSSSPLAATAAAEQLLIACYSNVQQCQNRDSNYTTQLLHSVNLIDEESEDDDFNSTRDDYDASIQVEEEEEAFLDNIQCVEDDESDFEKDDIYEQICFDREPLIELKTNDSCPKKNSFVGQHLDHSYCKSITEDEDEEDYCKQSKYMSDNVNGERQRQFSVDKYSSKSIHASLTMVKRAHPDPQDSIFKLPLTPIDSSQLTTSTVTSKPCPKPRRTTRKAAPPVNDENVPIITSTPKRRTVSTRHRCYSQFDPLQDIDDSF